MSKERIILVVLALIQMILILDFMYMMASKSLLVADLGISQVEFSYLISVYSFSAGVCGFLGVFFLDLFDRKKVLIGLLVGFIVGDFISGGTTSYMPYLLARSLTGACNGALVALILSIISDLIPEERRASAIGFVSASFGVASVIGVPGSLWLADNYHWQMPFYANGIFLCVTLVLVLVVISKMTNHLTNEKKENPFHVLKIIFSDGNMMRALLFTALLVLSAFSIIPFIAGFMETNVGYSVADVSTMYFIGGVVTVVLSPLIGVAADKFGKLKVFIAMAILGFAPFILLTQMGHMPFWLSLTINSLFFILISGRMVPATTMATSVVVSEYRGSFMSLRTAVQQFSMSVGSICTGIVTFVNEDGELVNFEYVGYAAVVLTVCAILVGRTLKVVEE